MGSFSYLLQKVRTCEFLVNWKAQVSEDSVFSDPGLEDVGERANFVPAAWLLTTDSAGVFLYYNLPVSGFPIPSSGSGSSMFVSVAPYGRNYANQILGISLDNSGYVPKHYYSTAR